jgi:hypothetical protein
MLNIPPFYHGLTRKVIVAFGSMFSNLKIQREKTDGTIGQEVVIPLTYAPKEKWLVRVEQDPGLEKHVYAVLPRMSFEITGMSYDASRKTNRMAKISCYDNSDPDHPNLKTQYSPVPYNIDVSLYILTKTQEDALQIVEQILPFFTPEFTLTIKAIPRMSVDLDIPIIMNSVNIEDNFDGDFQERRMVVYTINFTLKMNFFGPISASGPINTVYVNATGTDFGTKYSALGDFATGDITASWNDTP